jgi:hypothetical protein
MVDDSGVYTWSRRHWPLTPLPDSCSPCLQDISNTLIAVWEWTSISVITKLLPHSRKRCVWQPMVRVKT